MRALVYIALIIFCIPTGMLAQQDAYIDSVNNQLMLPMADTTKVNLLNRIAEDLYYLNQDKVIEYALLALELSEEIDYELGIANAYNNLGVYYRAKGIYNEAIDYFFNALKIMEQKQNQKGIARSYNFIGILYFYLENYDLSLEYYTKALNLNQEQNDIKWIAGNSNNIGMIYERKGRYDKALEYYMKSLEMNISRNDKNWIANNYGNIGSLYLKMDNPISLDYFTRRLKLSKEQGIPLGIARSNYQIGSYFMQYGEFKTAIPHLTDAYLVAKSFDAFNMLSDFSNKLSAVYDSLEIYDSAYYYQKIFKTWNDSLNLDVNTQKITRLRMQYQFSEKSHIKNLLYEKSRFRQTLSAIGLVFILVIILLMYGRKRARVKQQKLHQKQLELDNKALQEELIFKEKLLQDNIKYLLHKNDMITAILENLNQIKEKCQLENIRTIDDIIRELKAGTKDDTWNEFELRFNQIHRNFYNKLNQKYPLLTANEKKLCAFLKLNMSTKEIASMTQHSIKSIETARTRLRKKLNISSSSLTLTEFLDQL